MNPDELPALAACLGNVPPGHFATAPTGMTKREYAAIKIMGGLASTVIRWERSTSVESGSHGSTITTECAVSFSMEDRPAKSAAISCVELADALLAALAEPQEDGK